MKCNKCGNELRIKLASKVEAQGCEILTNMTTVLTAKCNKCGTMMQISLPSNSVFSVKKDKN